MGTQHTYERKLKLINRSGPLGTENYSETL